MEKNNKLIAEFMGCTHPHNEITDATLYNVSHGTFELSDLRYDVSWDWLVPALKKAQQEMSVNRAGLWKMITNPVDYNIKDVHNQLVEFIKDQNN